MKKFIILWVLLLIGAGTAAGQNGRLQGKVTSAGSPLPGVNIFLLGTTTGGVSDDNGVYTIPSIPAGDYVVRYSAVGYVTKTFDVTIQPGKTTELNVTLPLDVIEVDEVEVLDRRGRKQEDTRTSLLDVQPRSARMLAGAVTDVFRTLQAMPGVLAPSDYTSQLIVRGSTPDQNLIIMDDVEIYNPYRLYGVVSMFNPEAVSDISLLTGGFPAKYGDRLSAVLDITNKQGTTTENIKGNINASIISANLVLEGKNPFDIPGSWLVNFRRTYYDLIIEPFVKSAGLVEDNVTFPNFYDIQAKLALGPFNGHKFFINGIYSREGVDLISGEDSDQPDSLGVQDQSKNDVASFAWHYTPSKNTLNKLVVSWYRNSGDSELNANFLDPTLNRDDFEDTVPDTLSTYLLNFQFDSYYSFRKYSIDDKFTHLWGNNNTFEAGAGIDFMRNTFIFDFEIDPQLQAFFNSNPNVRSAITDVEDIRDYSRYRAYIQNNFSFGDKVFFHPGLRYDYYNLLAKGYLAPRISLSYAVDKLNTLRAAWGIYYQSPGYEKLRDRQVLFDLSPKYTEKLEAERAYHYILGYERWLSEEWTAKVEGYYKRFDNLIVQEDVRGLTYYTESVPGRDVALEGSWTRPVGNYTDSLTLIPVNGSYGRAYGLEFMIEKRNVKKGSRINGWISYALAFAERNEYRNWLPFRYDQRHTINLVLDYKLSDNLDLGFKFQYGSGFPVTEAVGITPRIIMQDTDGDAIPETPVIATREYFGGITTQEVIYDIDYGDRNNRLSSRKPAYHRLDIRLNYYTKFWNGDWTFYLDVLNVYNRSNVIGYDYSISEDLSLERRVSTMLPIVPTLGFNMRF